MKTESVNILAICDLHDMGSPLTTRAQSSLTASLETSVISLQYVAALSNDVEYLNSRDATIMGSRNGHAPIYMWFTLTRKGYEGMRKDVERCLRNAHLLKVLSPA